MGVWIETDFGRWSSGGTPVTPFVGVWIETFTDIIYSPDSRVTPFVGVWIETLQIQILFASLKCHTLRGCVD